MKNKVVLITGSSQGIGKIIALKFASLGAKVALNDIASQEDNLKKTQEEIGKGWKYFLADVSDHEEVEKMMAEIAKEFGGLDVLVNNAGICKDRTLAKMTQEEWQRVININLTGLLGAFLEKSFASMVGPITISTASIKIIYINWFLLLLPPMAFSLLIYLKLISNV